MLDSLLTSLLGIRKEYFICTLFLAAYITYYLIEAVKRPVVVCGDAGLRRALAGVPLLRARYWPTPWCVEARLQTVLGSLLRSLLLPPLLTTRTCVYPTRAVSPLSGRDELMSQLLADIFLAFRRLNYLDREVVTLSDGGQVALDWVHGGGGGGGGVLVVLPGLTGGAQADYVRALASAAAALGARCVVFNYRGGGGLPLTTPRLYSAVSHEDLREVVRWLRARAPAPAPLLAAGVSLGGLILAQYLARAGAAADLQAALAVSAPLDVERAAASAERAVNAPLARHMARNLRAAVRAHSQLRPHWEAVSRARSLREFDAAFTAGHFGFESAEAYYAAATLRGRLGAVRVPLLCLCAADDPFQPGCALPAAEAAGAARVALAVTARGGHIGFLEGMWPARAPHRQYIARLANQYFAALLARPHLLHRSAAADETL